MTKKEFSAKYADVIAKIYRANGQPAGGITTAADMLKYECKKQMGVIQGGDTYNGIPAGFDYAGCYQDIQSITD